ncbi:glutamate--tRNA ligase [Alicyclobacillus cycloheptanicus]|uniref:Glutamate--tRNA ligase n=1 Tax=Alicyclobacillus cycloheptanicus TaxID=1457 RepID=A0ABT9XD92_9BACL|nr:glutamate--tRNA ligase [Alicyclobacillus cycloheptanicus]MDQ0188235.1 glutamyl-tRNA synthetase [Alicyclobacillus cycloheptanicus]WDM00962.1 glutamate--tRNA ligase [Alicyclobacillus cycloheptanicus]
MQQRDEHIEERPVRVRFAPSPTGALHIGGARTAYFNWLFARQRGGVFVLRIDDTDRSRSTEASYQQILESFRWLGLDWDEGPDIGGPYGPYRQSMRQSIYEEALERLKKTGQVYPCFCTPEELAAEREAAQKAGKAPRYSGRCRHLSEADRAARIASGAPHTYRLHGPETGEVVVHDLIRGDVSFAAEEVDDFIIWKADGTPTYHFASCVDDGLMQISHIIRAEEHLSNTPRHIVLFEALGFDIPVFAHVPMILAPDRSKLSKRHGATSVEEYRQAGILPEALINYLLLLGFSPGDDEEVLSREEAIDRFVLERVSKHAAVYDVKKLEWLNAHYLHEMSPDKLLALVWDALAERGWVQPEEGRERLAWVRTALQAAQSRARNVRDVSDGLSFYFRPPVTYDAKGVKKHFASVAVADRLERAADALEAVKPFLLARVEETYRDLAAAWNIKSGELIHPTRLAISGVTVGPGLFDIMAILGREECQARMRRAAQAIRAGAVPITPAEGANANG